MGLNLLFSLCMLDKICIANRAQFGSESFICKLNHYYVTNSYSESVLASGTSLKLTTDVNLLYLN